jgi:hypothetical protein
MISETLKAWAAGIFDGEGTIMINKAGNSFTVLVCVVNNSKAMLDLIWDNWALKGCPEPYSSLCWRQTRRIYLNGGRSEVITFSYQDAKNLLTDILPYLVIKKENARIILTGLSKIEEKCIRAINGAPVTETISDILTPLHKEYKHLWARKPH